MENQLNIKKLTLNDVNALQTLSKQTFFETFVGTCSDEDMQNYLQESFSLTQLESELKNKEMLFYVAESEGEMLGYLKVNLGVAQTEKQSLSAVEIQRIYVLNQYHSKGVGQALFQQALDIAQKYQADYIWLGVWEHNHKAQNFYRKNGFVEFDKHTFMMGNDAQTDIMMKKILK
ncbi:MULTISPECIES: GNAT family N-acetyltransferase [unclassified Pasteurella]|uniref:GNAT family N-acetyltransferase n=1 Tax=unclassified Pasteurella TaxID=2621516 RepID=UPI0010743A67|nr:GNAT family N-acetyltransferase [Pasteurella sp. 19428wF3_WM03]TFU52590.1 GNAT family N-acetyltransferase [Pasteurella sp. WM03]